MNFKKLMLSLEKRIEEDLQDDHLARIRIKTLSAGLQAIELMKEHPRLESACVPLIVSHMELYAELLVMSQAVGSDIPSEEESLSLILQSAQTIGSA